MKKMPKSLLPGKLRKKFFAIMAKGCVTNIMTKGDRLDEILVEPEKAPNCSGYFGDELNMEYPVSNMIILYEVEYLCFVNVPRIGL